ncbi:hypothetical protein BDZ91DRAFT_799283 [Kalaharituber pfeilii]|nr:hypothetical protein BDZ91DRAFT_799283 [Kalaharituber pfeilii]
MEHNDYQTHSCQQCRPFGETYGVAPIQGADEFIRQGDNKYPNLTRIAHSPDLTTIADGLNRTEGANSRDSNLHHSLYSKSSHCFLGGAETENNSISKIEQCPSTEEFVSNVTTNTGGTFHSSTGRRGLSPMGDMCTNMPHRGTHGDETSTPSLRDVGKPSEGLPATRAGGNMLPLGSDCKGCISGISEYALLQSNSALRRTGCGTASSKSNSDSKNALPKEFGLVDHGIKGGGERESFREHAPSTQAQIGEFRPLECVPPMPGQIPENSSRTVQGALPEVKSRYAHIDTRLLRRYPTCHGIISMPFTSNEGTSSDKGISPIPVSMDAQKRAQIEEILVGRGLQLLAEFPTFDFLDTYVEAYGGIKYPIACVAWFKPYTPYDFYERSYKIFRWTFLFVTGEGSLHEWDVEEGGIKLGDRQNIEATEIGKKAAAWLVPGVPDEED